MISRVNLKTMIGTWFTLKTKDDINRKNWFNDKIESSYSNGVWKIKENLEE